MSGRVTHSKVRRNEVLAFVAIFASSGLACATLVGIEDLPPLALPNVGSGSGSTKFDASTDGSHTADAVSEGEGRSSSAA